VAEALKQNGYKTALFGKWHLHNWGSDGYYTRLFKEHAHHHGFDEVDPITDPQEYQAHGDKGVDFLTDQAIRFMENNTDSPFFVYLSHHTIHGPILAPDSLVDEYRLLGYPEEGQQNATYLAAIHHFDNSIGRLTKAIDRLGIADNTLIIFTSDNGGVDTQFDNAPLRNGKGSMYEGGIRVPLIARWSGVITPGSVNSTPIHVVDFYPSLVDVAGGIFPKNHILDGKSIMPLLLEKAGWENRPLFWYMPLYDPKWGATPSAIVRKGNYKLIRFFGDYMDMDKEALYIPQPRTELYNLDLDLSETKDLTTELPLVVEELNNELDQWLEQMEVELPTVNPDFNYDSAFVRSRERPW
jgi:arylsulfatase A-like enzyme